jgi:hypothetical protein
MAAISFDDTFEQYYYIDIFLTQTQKNLGMFNIITNNEIIGDLPEFDFTSQNTIPPITPSDIGIVTLTGLTASRLNEVKTYTGEYKVGVNGVILVLDSLIIYEIDGISYQTLLDGFNTTYYFVTKSTNEFEMQNVLRDDNSVSIDIKKTLNGFLVERSNISLYDYFNKISNCDKLDDLLDIF